MMQESEPFTHYLETAAAKQPESSFSMQCMPDPDREHLHFPSLVTRNNRMLKKSTNGHRAWGVTPRVKQSLTMISPDPKELGTAVTSNGI
jgi:hypothetical protein